MSVPNATAPLGVRALAHICTICGDEYPEGVLDPSSNCPPCAAELASYRDGGGEAARRLLDSVLDSLLREGISSSELRAAVQCALDRSAVAA
jgi:predicted  nucleic acid-binding Zn-ribbon protein